MPRQRISKYKRINKPDELPAHRFQDTDTLILSKVGEYRYITTAMLGVPLAMEPFCTVNQAYSHFEPFQAVFDQSPSLAKTNPGILI